ncbi:nuclear transport factor 2 family protein [Rubrivirga sp.]|uniref:nuclear transport factor 2 family protein n=1 Tax=Rubrivirga sp. TaxID=1885344 RepID=UPI003C733810
MATSPQVIGLDEPAPDEWASRPFFDETRNLFRYVRAHDFDRLADLCDDDFGIVDIGPEGESVPAHTREEWETWFRTLFAQLDAMGAETDTEIQTYDALVRGELGYAVVRFCQTLTVGGKTGRFDCIVTIIWKREGDRWVESRWHASLLRRDLPEGFGQ